MAILTPDKTTTLCGVNVKEYLLTGHNPNHIDMPSVSMAGKIIGVTVHNTDWITVARGTTPAEQYTRATVNGNMKDVRVHYYVDNVCAWQNLPHNLSGWHAADGSGNGNRRTIAIECIMSSSYNSTDKKSEDNAAKLAAALLKQYGLDINHLYTHTHWLNVRDGRNGTVDQLNTMHNSYKMCPAYILPHWAEFKAKVQAYLKGTSAAKPSNGTSSQLYRVRKSANDMKSQLGAYASLENAKKACKAGYSVFDSSGKVVYTNSRSGKFAKGQAVHIGSNVPLFANETTSTPAVRLTAGTYYIYDGVPCKLGRYRITTTAANCGRTPVGKFVTGYVSWDNFK
jgi:N-acetylmuramoyl-L-alanine amidase CwlA